MDATISQLISDYGYLAVFGGTLLEGEAILLLAGYAAHEGYLSIGWVIAVACVGATLGDQMFFFIGRRFGGVLLERFPKLRRRVERVNARVVRNDGWIIVSLRFAYGLRIAGPIALGLSTLSARRFLMFNALGALIWAPLIAGAGYLFGESLQWLMNDLRTFELYGLAGIGAVGALAFGISRLVASRRNRP
ncbi:MAG TPA: DedA family protein [Caldimonas sp.]|nr:DedA family protein [Caldimonas sp.]